MTVSLVLPCYNPPTGWEQTVCEAFRSFCSFLQDEVELIIVVDGTDSCVSITPASLSVLESNISKLKIVKYPLNRGKGYAIRQGVTVASGDLILYTDIDFPYKTESMVNIYSALKNTDVDVAVGVKDAAYYAHVPFVRRAISRYLRLLIRVFLSMPITDTQCGLKGFKKNVVPLFLQTTIDRYLFDLEFIRNCFRSGKLHVKAVPVSLNDDVHFRSMNYRILFSEAVNFIRLLGRR